MKVVVIFIITTKNTDNLSNCQDFLLDVSRNLSLLIEFSRDKLTVSGVPLTACEHFVRVGLFRATDFASDQTQAFVFAHFFKMHSPFQSLTQ